MTTGDGMFDIQLAQYVSRPTLPSRESSRGGLLRSRAAALGLCVADPASSYEPMTNRDARRELVRGIYGARAVRSEIVHGGCRLVR